MAFTPGYGMERVASQTAPSGGISGVQLTPSYPFSSSPSYGQLSSTYPQQAIHSPQYYEMNSPYQHRYISTERMVISQPHLATIASPTQRQHSQQQHPPHPQQQSEPSRYPRFLTPPRRELEAPSVGNAYDADDQYNRYSSNTRITRQQQPSKAVPVFNTPPRNRSPTHSHPQRQSDARQDQQQPRQWRSGIQAPPPMMTPSSPTFEESRVDKFRSQHLTPPHPLPPTQQYQPQPQLVGNQSMVSSVSYSPLNHHQSNLTLDTTTGASFLHSQQSTHASFSGGGDFNISNDDEKLSQFRRNAEDYYSSRLREASVLNRAPRPTLPFEPEVESGNQQLLPKHYDTRYPSPTHHGMSSYQHQLQQQHTRPPGPKRATSAERAQRTNKTDPWFVSDTYISPSRRRMNHGNHTNNMPPHIPSMSHIVSSPRHSPNYSLSPMSDFLTPKSPERVEGASLSPIIRKIISERF